MDIEIRRDQVMVINSKGQRKVITATLYDKLQNNPKSVPEELRDYEYDIEWYLSHRWKEINQMFNEIENGYQEHAED